VIGGTPLALGERHGGSVESRLLHRPPPHPLRVADMAPSIVEGRFLVVDALPLGPHTLVVAGSGDGGTGVDLALAWGESGLPACNTCTFATTGSDRIVAGVNDTATSRVIERQTPGPLFLRLRSNLSGMHSRFNVSLVAGRDVDANQQVRYAVTPNDTSLTLTLGEISLLMLAPPPGRPSSLLAVFNISQAAFGDYAVSARATSFSTVSMRLSSALPACANCTAPAWFTDTLSPVLASVGVWTAHRFSITLPIVVRLDVSTATASAVNVTLRIVRLSVTDGSVIITPGPSPPLDHAAIAAVSAGLGGPAALLVLVMAAMLVARQCRLAQEARERRAAAMTPAAPVVPVPPDLDVPRPPMPALVMPVPVAVVGEEAAPADVVVMPLPLAVNAGGGAGGPGVPWGVARRLNDDQPVVAAEGGLGANDPAEAGHEATAERQRRVRRLS
jgi:hypothetical protein